MNNRTNILHKTWAMKSSAQLRGKPNTNPKYLQPLVAGRLVTDRYWGVQKPVVGFGEKKPVTDRLVAMLNIRKGQPAVLSPVADRLVAKSNILKSQPACTQSRYAFARDDPNSPYVQKSTAADQGWVGGPLACKYYYNTNDTIWAYNPSSDGGKTEVRGKQKWVLRG